MYVAKENSMLDNVRLLLGSVFAVCANSLTEIWGSCTLLKEPNGESLNVTSPYRLGGRLFGTLKSNFAVSKGFGWLVAGMSSDISHSRRIKGVSF